MKSFSANSYLPERILAGLIASMMILISLSACTEEGQEEVKISRVAAVKKTETKPEAPVKTSGWCDHAFKAGKGPKLALPPVEAAAGAPYAGFPKDKRLWINLWATWCKPCMREMPLLRLWRESLAKEGLEFKILFLSVDDETGPLRDYLKTHADGEGIETVRLTDQKALEGWLKQYELPADTAIPIHLIVSPGGEVRCVRTGGLSDGDLETIRQLMR